jgi:uncharacterized membrane protein YfcA
LFVFVCILACLLILKIKQKKRTRRKEREREEKEGTRWPKCRVQRVHMTRELCSYKRRTKARIVFVFSAGAFYLGGAFLLPPLLASAAKCMRMLF